MSLTAGSKLGPYEIVAPIGKGGMGEVYKAHDSRLRRDVAIKVSAEKFSERFEREARAVAALNHPNICTLYDVGPNYLVMEYIEGESPKGPLPLDEAIGIALQIADALEAAHDKGITHRDLKPANIMIRPDGSLKVLDFGLAQHVQQRSDSDVDNSPTLTMGMTAAGAIMGTAAYMAPEQARGKKLDKRADIWAFGVVFYELVTGKRLFQGEDIVEILAAVVHGQPDLSGVPAKARRVLERCLEKDPRKRLHDISSVALLLETAPPVMAGTNAVVSGGKTAWIVAGALALVAAGALWFALRPAEKLLRPLARYDVDLGQTVSLGSQAGADVVISPDATRIVYVSGSRLYTLRLDQPKAASVELPGTLAAFAPFFSPDGKWIGFFGNGQMRKIAVDGGVATVLSPAAGGPRGGSWGEDGNIIASLSSAGPLSLISSAGGEVKPLTKLAEGEVSHRWPQILPGNEAVLFAAGATNFDAANIEVVSLKDGRRKVVQRGGSYPRYVAASDGFGYLTFVTRGTLFAVPFDLKRLEVSGTPAPLLDDIGYSSSFGAALAEFSQNGTVVYRNGSSTGLRSVQWMDVAGKTQTVLDRPDFYLYPRLSPDGQRLAIVATEGGTQDIWVYDVRGGRSSRLTIGIGATFLPTWTPDSRYIVYQAPGGMYWTRADGASQPQQLLPSKDILYPYSFTPDGKRLAYADVAPETSYDLWTVPIEIGPMGLKAGKPEKFLVTPRDERHPAFSPDGRWIAFASDETGKPQVYVRAFPDTGGRWTISSSGGHYPVFSQNGHDLFYRTEDGQIMMTSYAVKGDAFVADPPHLWSEKRLFNIPANGTYDVAPDGKRIVGVFAAEIPGSERAQSHVTFLVNFADEIRRRVGAGR